ncbi:Diacylglycerol O-acyltransferase 2 [Wickerhamomyces ciferrii]|uniref:Diacylglycerol O-acyltransferase n=1 Tax=Wickerhamomyces ciferrii (strain ATCC 14091 / BCRC 22168 / CBS 111 / JCM 3599 / NBRC 0793 / NRRL Y-1031 F-60-10) TaxID=1206466 RepID=K0KJ47_WICCF|nr:Diacylglycerol O-acyltransferase 2 [Wickerhamomyces ciferrii]CCH41133.1 Diacylglycerol O-acyltransferase 2 [Wickerhamomyces ciferrii]
MPIREKLKPVEQPQLSDEDEVIDSSKNGSSSSLPKNIQISDDGRLFKKVDHRQRSMTIGNVRVAPLTTPLPRRLQTAAVLWHTVSIPVFITIFFIALAIPVFWIFAIPYLIYLFTDETPSNGNATKRYSEWFRKLSIWKNFAGYYPVKIFKTHNLEPTFTEVEIKDDHYWLPPPLSYLFQIKKKPYKKKEKTGPKYIFGLHPHGVVSLSGFGAIGTDGANWSKLFPGVPVCLLTLLNQFYIPIYRDYLLALGITSAGRNNALKVLKNGFSLAIVVGGAQESLLARPESTEIVLQKRKGFIKLALETGNVSLVPCYAFGENELYNILEPGQDSYWRKLQLWLKKNFGFTIPFFHARGVFNYDFGLLPFRKEVTIVTGKPIEVPFLPSPNKKEVDHYHELYVNELKRIFEEYKSKFAENPEAKLEIVE